MLLAVLMTARMRPSLATTSFLPTRRRQELRTSRADKPSRVGKIDKNRKERERESQRQKD